MYSLTQCNSIRHMTKLIWVNIGSGNGLLPDGTKPLPEPMLTHRWWRSVASPWEQFQWICPRYQINKTSFYLHFNVYNKYPRGQWVIEIIYSLWSFCMIRTNDTHMTGSIWCAGMGHKAPWHYKTSFWKSKLAKSRLPITYLSVTKPFWNFLQDSRALHKIGKFGNWNGCYTNEILRD